MADYIINHSVTRFKLSLYAAAILTVCSCNVVHDLSWKMSALKWGVNLKAQVRLIARQNLVIRDLVDEVETNLSFIEQAIMGLNPNVPQVPTQSHIINKVIENMSKALSYQINLEPFRIGVM